MRRHKCGVFAVWCWIFPKSFSVNYKDIRHIQRPYPKRQICRGIPFISGKSRLVYRSKWPKHPCWKMLKGPFHVFSVASVSIWLDVWLCKRDSCPVHAGAALEMPPNEAAQWVQAREGEEGSMVSMLMSFFCMWMHMFVICCRDTTWYNNIIEACVELFAFIVNQSTLSIPLDADWITVFCWHLQMECQVSSGILATQSWESQAWQKHGSDRLMLPLLRHWEW